MKLNNTWHYLAMAAMLGVGACSSSRQTAQNAGEVDDLYGNSGDAVVYANDTRADERRTTQQDVRRASRFDRQQLGNRSLNANPDYVDGQEATDGTDAEYYSELSARQVQRGISPDPGWGADYNDGFTNGYNQGLYSANSINRWGWNNTGLFNNGFSLGLGLGSAWGWGGGFNRWNSWGNPYAYGGGFYDSFYSPFGYNSYAFSPFGYGLGGFGGFSPFGYGYGYNPYAFGAGYRNGVTIINNNNYVTGADPYRSNRTYGLRNGTASARYNGDFTNSAPRNGGRRAGSYGSAYDNSGNNTGTSYGNATGRGSSRGAGSYSNGTPATGGRRAYGNTSGTYTPATGSSSAGTYYERPARQGSYSSGTGSSRGSYSQPSQSRQSQSTYSQPSRQAQSTYSQPSQPSYQAPARTYSAPSTPSYSAPSAPSSSGGGGGYSSGAGSSRGPR